MNYQSFPGGHWVIRLDKGDEIMASLRDFCLNHDIRGASFMAFGAVENVRLGCYMPTERAYWRHTVERQVEVVSLLGNIGWFEGRPVIHAHAAVGDYSQQTFSGHLEDARVNPTLEVFLTDLGAELIRESDEESGLKVLKLTEEEKAA